MMEFPKYFSIVCTATLDLVTLELNDSLAFVAYLFSFVGFNFLIY
jgi:hypothetical protein